MPSCSGASRLAGVPPGPGEVWGPRTLDVDIIVYGDLVSDDPELTLPHPRAQERAFVLAPWLDADPDAEHPGPGPGVGSAGQRSGRAGVRRRDDSCCGRRHDPDPALGAGRHRGGLRAAGLAGAARGVFLAAAAALDGGPWPCCCSGWPRRSAAGTCGPVPRRPRAEAGPPAGRGPDGRPGQGQLARGRGDRRPGLRVPHLPGQFAGQVGAAQDAFAAGGTVLAAVVLLLGALYLEYSCRVPTDDDRDNEPTETRR